MSARARRAALGGAVLLVVAWACTMVPTDQNAVLSLQIIPPALPSIVCGDQLHDLTGAVDSLHALAFNNQGDTIAGAPITFLIIAGRDTAQIVAVNHVMGIDTGTAHVIAIAGALQTNAMPLAVVLRPDSLVVVGNADTALTFNQVPPRDTTLPLRVQLLHFPAGATCRPDTATVPPDTSGVPRYRLHYAFTGGADPANTDAHSVLLVNSALQPQLVDTTIVGGFSTLALMASFFTVPGDSMVGVDVSAFAPDDMPVRGSPVHFNVHVIVQ